MNSKVHTPVFDHSEGIIISVVRDENKLQYQFIRRLGSFRLLGLEEASSIIAKKSH
jgi:hypothetical protein